MEMQKNQKMHVFKSEIAKILPKMAYFPRFFLASFSSRGIPRIEIPHSSFLIEGLASLMTNE